MISRIEPLVHRTSLVSAAGGYWKCMPRNVPLVLLNAMLACAIVGFSAWAENSFWQNARAKKPRPSSRRSMSIMKAPLSLVSVNIMVVFRNEIDSTLHLPVVTLPRDLDDVD